MSVETFKKWTCERCSLTVELPIANYPKGWIGLKTVMPLDADFDDSRRRHYCDSCDTALAQFLESPEVFRGNYEGNRS